MSNKAVKLLAGIRLSPAASRTVGMWSKLTGKSVNWITSWTVERLCLALINANTIVTAREELEALGRVQTELQLSYKRVTAAKQKLSAIRNKESTDKK